MTISEYSVQRPVTMIVIFALLMVVAGIMVPRLAVDMFPDTTRPVLSVSTSYAGAGPEDVESNITEPLEKALAGVTGLEEIRSTSSFERSRITLEFGYDVDLDQAKSDVESILAAAGNILPDDAGSPTVFQFNMSSIPILRLVVRGNYPIEELKSVAEDTIQAQIERIEGVASTSVSGGNDRIVEVAVSQNRLAAFGMSLSEISSVLSSQNVLVGGGTMVQGGTEYQLMTSETLSSVDEVRGIVLRTIHSGGSIRVVRLEDVADVSMVYNDSSSRVYINGEPGVYIQVQNESDSNSVQVSRTVREVLDGINSELPEGITLEVLSDTTTMIEATLNQVYQAAIQGAFLAMAVLLFFLRNFKGTFIIGLAMPISILITLMCMAIFDLTLNLLTLTGLVLGLGMILDGSIVILENIHAYRERGAKPSTAAILGSQEMFRAIVASTTTTLCVFIPVIIFRADLEMMGQMFGDLVFTVVISLIVSLSVALIVVPALAGPIMRLSTRVQKPLKLPLLRKLDAFMEDSFRRFQNGYRRALEYSLSHRSLVLLLVLVILIYSLLQFGGMGMNLFVRGSSDDQISINVSMPPGTSIDETEALLKKLQSSIEQKVKGYENIVLTAGSRGGWGSSSGNTGSIQINLPAPEEQIDTPSTIRAKLSEDLASLPGAQVEFSAGRRMGSSSPIDIEIRSANSQAAMETAESIRNILLKMPVIQDPLISLESGGPQLRISINRERAAILGVSTKALANQIKTAVSGSTVTTMSDGGGEISVRLRLREEDISAIPDLEALFLTNSSGDRIPLSSVADVYETRSPSDIDHENQQRIIHVTSDLAEGMAATEMQELVRSTVEAGLIPSEEVDVIYSGEAQDIRRFEGSFLVIIVAAIVLVFGVMASQFESFVDPFIIFFSIPLLFIGVIWIYTITGEPFSLFSAVGVVALVGIVVNNGIVLVDYTNTLRSRGMKVREACIAAGVNRLQPILMTTLTTIFGMTPLAFFPGEGAETIQPIAKTLVGGLTVSSVMTLFVTPVMYSVLNRRHDVRLEKKRGRLGAMEVMGMSDSVTEQTISAEVNS